VTFAQDSSAWVLQHVSATALKGAALVAFHKAQAAATLAVAQAPRLTSLRPAALRFQAAAHAIFVRLRHQLQTQLMQATDVSLSTEAASAVVVLTITSALLLPLRLCCGAQGGRRSRARTPPSRVVQGGSAVRSLSPPPVRSMSPPPEGARRRARARG
jgi:hypothetical protein